MRKQKTVRFRIKEKFSRSAQKHIMRGGNEMIHGGLHLRGTKYEKSWDRLYKALNTLNNKLIKDINKVKKKK